MKTAIETTLDQLSLAIEADGKVYEKTVTESQVENLIPVLDDLLKKAGKNPKEISEIFITAGPGSFTGIRIGLAAAKALALGTGAKIYTFETFDLVEASHFSSPSSPLAGEGWGEGELKTAIDTKRGDYYVRDGKTYAIVPEEELEKETDVLYPNEKTTAKTLLTLPKEKARSEDTPFYMRPPEISCPKK